eukprot:m.300294 g.300294  ORF g.300294 m.300294 type:complete len:103 (+) comp40793_c0_seq1:3141-3449(+)
MRSTAEVPVQSAISAPLSVSEALPPAVVATPSQPPSPPTEPIATPVLENTTNATIPLSSPAERTDEIPQKDATTLPSTGLTPVTQPRRNPPRNRRPPNRFDW